MEPLKLSDLEGLERTYRLADGTAAEIWDLLKGCIDASDVKTVMEEVDELLGTSGVEYITDTLGRATIIYCNTGDSYAHTVVWFVEEEVFVVTSWADAVESLEAAESDDDDDDDIGSDLDEDEDDEEDEDDDYEAQYVRTSAPFIR